jgi:hypothetical protein
MWPFGSTERANNEYIERFLELEKRVMDLQQRFKVLEREQEDLHAAYRRLRASRAQEAVQSGGPGGRGTGEPKGNHDDSEQTSAVLTKDELRRKYLGTRRVLPEQDR